MSIKTVDIDVSDGEPEGNPDEKSEDVDDLDRNEQYAPLEEIESQTEEG